MEVFIIKFKGKDSNVVNYCQVFNSLNNNILKPTEILSYDFNDCECCYEYTSRKKKQNEKGVIENRWWFIKSTLSYESYILERTENPKLPEIKVSSIVYKM